MRCAAVAGAAWLAALLSMAAPAVQAQDAARLGPGSEARVAASTRVNLRSRPSTAAGAVIGKLLPGDLVTITESSIVDGRAWYRVELGDGEQGWVAGTLLEGVDLAAPAAAPSAPTELAAEPSAPSFRAIAPAEPAEAPPETLPPLESDWTTMLPGLLESVDACAAVPSLQPVVITRVYRIEPNLVGVRMEDPSGRRTECIIQSSSIYPLRYEPLVAGLRPMPGDGNPRFIRVPGEPLNDQCHRSDEIRDARGETVIGWRVRDLCR
jgi:SH3-like domain-containing protein